MTKRPFLVFVICGVIVIAMGIYFHFTKENQVFRIEGDGPLEYRLYKGWQIILMGLIMLMIGFVLNYFQNRKIK
jgi:uncharacterized membrane protein